MGLGEGVTFPCIQNLIATDVPTDNNTQSLSLIYSGVQVWPCSLSALSCDSPVDTELLPLTDQLIQSHCISGAIV